MVYKTFQDLKLSALGMGCMRLPVLNGDDAKVDEKAAAEMVGYAMAHGVNYYDTAWGYHSGQSELVLGKALAQYPRGDVRRLHERNRRNSFQYCKRIRKQVIK